ncbi:MAG: NAD-glutamate dehydrogenase, partial [Candidatus Eremiobacteraeota bacterium]|nr:NAD-glutamate dehydrogenase [Candidatus Eremiobacteraeota bacterium]
MTATLEKLADHIERRVPTEETPFLKEFSVQLFEKASPGFLREFDPESLMAITLGALRVLEERSLDDIWVRAFNPSYEADGWDCPWTALEVSLRDRPFIVDSITHELKRQSLDVYHLLHPIYYTHRDEDGRLRRDLTRSPQAGREVYELYLIERVEDEAGLRALEERVRQVLCDVVLATDDYQAMRAKVASLCESLAGLRSDCPDDPQVGHLEECESFLNWLTHHNFVFLGFREYDILEQPEGRFLQVNKDTALGILKNLESSNYQQPVPLSQLPDNLRQRVTSGPLMIVTKANAESTVHRPVRMDYVGLKKLDKDFNIVGEMRFLGLFTSSALTTPVKDIPILRHRLRQVLDLDQAIEGSHDYKQIVTIFNSMPREELFWSDAVELHRDIRTIMAMQQEHEVRLTIRPDPLTRGLLVMVIMPRDRFNTAVRNDVQELLAETFGANQVDYQLSMGEDEEQVRFHFFLTTDVDMQGIDLPELERKVVDMTKTWSDRLTEKLVSTHGEARGHRLSEDYANSFPDGYVASAPLGMAVRDITNIGSLLDSEDRYRVDIVNPMEERYGEAASHVRIYHRDDNLVLSQVLPVLENLGLRVLLQSSHKIATRGRLSGLTATIDVFRVQDKRSGKPLDVRKDKKRLVEAMVVLLEGRAENDRLNGLITSGGLSWREVSLLKTYQMYLSQVSVGTSRHFINDTLLAHPECAAELYRYFASRFDPELEERQGAMDEHRSNFFDLLNGVSSLAYDRTLRNLFNLMESTVRTNFFKNKEFISHKVSSRQVKEMPEPRPLYEIVVSGPGVEGIHLRGGMVARGGLRWSDRPDDFRTEVLGLMKTQMTKNAVIVPVGSKGGFVVKRAPQEREALMGYVVEQYKTFIRGLLDLTDNNQRGEIVQPEGLVIYDGPDPYLVVAADKGTATFSDIANSVSAEYDFWLGDAFASGGSQGYDHKKEGITARGAWEGVRRHFFELGIDVMQQEFTCIGIGDMSGDVFGNGLLYTDKIRLQAAFNHMHIFLDPTPDA